MRPLTLEEVKEQVIASNKKLLEQLTKEKTKKKRKLDFLVHENVFPELAGYVERGEINLYYSPLDFSLREDGSIVLNHLDKKEGHIVIEAYRPTTPVSLEPLRAVKHTVFYKPLTPFFAEKMRYEFEGTFYEEYVPLFQMLSARKARIPKYRVSSEKVGDVVKMVMDGVKPDDIVEFLQGKAVRV